MKEMSISDRAQWLKIRRAKIGASDASAILGINPWKTNIDLYREKAGITKPEDISQKPQIIYGNKAEAPIRELFALEYSDKYSVFYKPFDMIVSAERDWQVATLDGRLHDNQTGATGVLEIKTSRIQSGAMRDSWQDGIPQYYFSQIVHQLSVTGFTFAVVRARLIFPCFGDKTDMFDRVEERTYYFDAQDLQGDIDFLNQKEDEFYFEYLQKGTEPPMKLAQI